MLTCKVILSDSPHPLIVSKNPGFRAIYFARRNEFCFISFNKYEIYIFFVFRCWFLSENLVFARKILVLLLLESGGKLQLPNPLPAVRARQGTGVCSFPPDSSKSKTNIFRAKTVQTPYILKWLKEHMKRKVAFKRSALKTGSVAARDGSDVQRIVFQEQLTGSAGNSSSPFCRSCQCREPRAAICLILGFQPPLSLLQSSFLPFFLSLPSRGLPRVSGQPCGPLPNIFMQFMQLNT